MEIAVPVDMMLDFIREDLQVNLSICLNFLMVSCCDFILMIFSFCFFFSCISCSIGASAGDSSVSKKQKGKNRCI